MSETNPRNALVETLEYVKRLIELGQTPVFQLSEHRNFCVLEGEAQGLPGIRFFRESSDGAPVWMEIERLHASEPPALPEALSEWVDVSRDAAQTPELKEWRVVTLPVAESKALVAKGRELVGGVSEEGKIGVRLSSQDDPELRATLERYLEEEWYPWAVVERPRRETIALYGKLFGVHQKVSVGETDGPLEIVWGVGHATWEVEEESGELRQISHPVVEFQVELEMDSSQAILVRPRDPLQAKPRMNLEAFEALGNPGVPALNRFFEQELVRLEEAEQLLTAEDPASYEPILRNAVAQLSEGGRYWPDITKDATDRSVPAPSEDLTITGTWALFARKMRPNALAEDIEKLQAQAKEAESTERDVAFRFVELPADVRSSEDRGGEPASAAASEADRKDDADTVGGGVDLFFPKPYNEAQKEIVRQLEKAHGVVVQGPPGTGKTHTIANIICHYLALGRRVLVTAKSETALKVLKDQIPKAIQPLVVSLVSSDHEGMRQQREAIETLQARVITLQGQEGSLHHEIRKGEAQIAGLEAELETIAQEVESLARGQLERVTLPFLEEAFKNATELAKWVVEGQERFRWFEDTLGVEERFEPRFSKADLERLHDAKATIGQDLPLLGVSIPQVEELPSAKEIARAHRDLVARDQLIATASKGALLEGLTPERMEALESAGSDVRSVMAWLGELREEEAWLGALFAAKVEGAAKLPHWYLLASELKEEAGRLLEERNEYLRQPIDFGTDDAEALTTIREAAERAAEGKSALTFLQRFKSGEKELLSGVNIVGQAPDSPSMWKHVLAYFVFNDNCRRLALRWNALAKESPLPTVDEANGLRELGECIELFATIEANADKLKLAWDVISEAFKDSERRLDLSPTPEALGEIAALVEMNVARYRLTASEALRESAVERLSGFEFEEANQALEIVKGKLGLAAESEEALAEDWRRLCSRFKALQDLQPSFQALASVCGTIAESGATKWSRRLRSEVGNEEEAGQIDDALEAWNWARARSVFLSGDAQRALAELEDRRHGVETRLHSTLESLVERKTYLALCATMSVRAKSLLSQFMSAVANVGTGVGKKAPFYRAAAQKAMHGCAGAIPCWIMPSWRASEVLPAELGYFDLVIVDEASQCDIRELPALARGRKVLIVGDDKQVSPTIVGLEFNRVLQLKRNYLKNQPFASLMLPESSLYDLASSVFAGRQILLNEHFRCVEPIIRFSFQFYRKNGILPVRVPKAAERMDPPLVGVYVRNGYRVRDVNKPEAKAIVDEIKRLVDDPNCKGRSIGVISMVGSKQAEYINDRLLEAIGQRRFLEHDIVCGDSATFQGREKDIVFISLVVAAGRKKIQKVTSRMWEQRFNVAASRARDRMYVYYSVKPDELSSDDLKARLLAHLREPMPSAPVMDGEFVDLCETPFERDVFAKLRKLGYCVTPQVPCAGRRLDLVVEGENDARLAIELDGDTYHGPEVWLEDWSRQKILERVGWKVWRCWYSSYVAAPEACIAALVERLEKEGIRPVEGKSVSRNYTEFREVGGASDVAIPTEMDEESVWEETVEVGDTVFVTRGDPKDGYAAVRIVDNEGDPAKHVYAKEHPIAQALLGLVVEDEVDLEIAGASQRVCIARLDKGSSAPVVVSEARSASPDAPVKLNAGEGKRALKEPSDSEPSRFGGVATVFPDPSRADEPTLVEYMGAIVEEMGPMIARHALSEYIRRSCVSKLGVQAESRLMATLQTLIDNGKLVLVAESSGGSLAHCVVRTSDQEDVCIRPGPGRDLDDIPKNELQAVYRQIASDQPDLDEDDRLRAVLAFYGKKRLNDRARQILISVAGDAEVSE